MIGETTLFWVKVAGASIGSSIAVVFKPGQDKGWSLVKRFILGTIIGFIAAPVVIDWLNWEHTVDYWLAAATFSGLLGYLFLQLLFSEAAARAVKSRLNAK